MFIVARCLLGAGEGFFFVAALAAASDIAPQARRGEALSFLSLSLYLGLAIGPPIAEVLFAAGSYDAVWIAAAGGRRGRDRPVAGSSRRSAPAVLDPAAATGRRRGRRSSTRPASSRASSSSSACGGWPASSPTCRSTRRTSGWTAPGCRSTAYALIVVGLRVVGATLAGPVRGGPAVGRRARGLRRSGWRSSASSRRRSG